MRIENHICTNSTHKFWTLSSRNFDYFDMVKKGKKSGKLKILDLFHHKMVHTSELIRFEMDLIQREMTIFIKNCPNL